MRKRGNGYTYRYNIPITKPDGTPGRKQKDTKQYPTPLEAYNEGIKIEGRLIDGTYIDEKNILFVDWIEPGLTMHASANNRKESTVDARRSHLYHAKNAFAGKKLKDITPHMYQAFLMSLRDKHHLGNSSIQGAHSAMSILFKLAKKLKMIQNDPTREVDIPKVEVTFEQLELLEDEDGPLPEYLEKEQLAELLKTAKKRAAEMTDPKEAFGARQLYRGIYLLAHTGLRIGELCALEKKRWDLKNRTVRIIATLYHRNGIRAYKLTPPKTKKSIRTVDFSESIASVLESQLHDLKVFRLLVGEQFYTDTHNKREFTFINFCMLPGYPLCPVQFNEDLKEVLGLAGLPTSITAHDLRHTFTSLSAEAGVPLEDVRKQLGHTSDKMTERVYYHVTKTRRRANVDKLDNLLGGLLPNLD